MKLLRFRVTNFRSVDDSGWVHTDNVTALIGTNESGKTNVLLPLWKLNPAKEGQIDPLSDFPRKHYNTFRNQEPSPIFITAIFDMGDELAGELAREVGLPTEQMREVQFRRRFNGDYDVHFPGAAPARKIESQRIFEALDHADKEIEATNPLKTEEELKAQLLLTIRDNNIAFRVPADVEAAVVDRVQQALEKVDLSGAPKTSTIVPRFQRLTEQIQAFKAEISFPHPDGLETLTERVLELLPKFVYYSNYGNLDSEIYLPYVIKNLKRTDLGSKEQAKARTLRVLFDFVKLKPEEILELGLELKEPPPNQTLTPQQIAEAAERKKERSILLQSASVDLTRQFRAWWKRGDYRFRFEADGNHFRIWVSDDKRPEEIELEGRSTGLQWFLSFYLVFLVERSEAHADAILLLDEPGLSLHPLAQQDLSAFFDGLAETNQLLYTSHSPFLIDADRLDRARKVYVAEDGTSKVTADLSSTEGDSEKRGAGYAVHAALGLTVAESILIGCKPVIVEGASDQHYLSGIKIVLIAAGKLKPGRELVFPPSGGVKGVKAIVSILGARDEALPVTLFDSDEAGRGTMKALKDGLYADQPDMILEVGTFTGMPDTEIEDLFPQALIARELDRWQRNADTAFSDEVKAGQPIVPQIEEWAKRNGITLKKPGWKVELAKRVKQKLISDGLSPIPEPLQQQWLKIFEAFQSTEGA